MSELDLALALVGGMVLVLGLLSRPLERVPLTAPLAALLLGIALGPQALDLLHPEQWGERERILEVAARITIAIGLMGIALRLPPGYFRAHWRSLAVLLALVLPLMALGAGLLAYWLLGVPLLVALLIGAVVSPTDPIIATSIVTGTEAERNLPERLRHLLLGESGANDGLAYPLVFLPLLLMLQPGAAALGEWLLVVMLWKVGMAVVAGIALGRAGGRLLLWAERHHTIELPSFFAYTAALTLLVLGVSELLELDGILAVFVSGIAFGGSVGSKERAEDERVQEAINRFFTPPVFVLIGLVLPWAQWAELGWRGVALAALVLVLRRLPAVLLLARFMPDLASRKDALFAGWFGPIGVAALLYAMLAVQGTGHDIIWTAVSLLIFASVLAHGVSAAPLGKRYARRAPRRAAA
jgi:sodium/hydrogen antiporter